MTEIYGKGHELLAFFNIDYHLYIADITNQLMRNPNKNFRLSVERIPKQSRKNK